MLQIPSKTDLETGSALKPEPAKIYIEFVDEKIRQHGPLYDVEYNGEIILRSHKPFFDGARALLALGVTGRFEMWDRERPYPRMLGDIEKAAALDVRETSKHGPRIVKYRKR